MAHADVPLRLKLGEDLALGVVAEVADIDEGAQVEAGGSELRHGGRWAVSDGSRLRVGVGAVAGSVVMVVVATTGKLDWRVPHRR